VDQLREIAQLDLFSEHMVSDFMIEKDRLFALLTLTEDEQQLYQKMFESLRPQVSAPDLVVLLQASPTSLIERIQQRGIAMEQNMSEEYLTQLSEAYTRFFHQYEEAPILIVNTASLNPIDREEDFEALVGQIANFRGRRAYFNLAG
jgi:deoxyadenosine/deoxycytidine kinase